jgi:hypothetical protein
MIRWNSIAASAKQYGVKLDNKIVFERAFRLSRAFISIGDFEKQGCTFQVQSNTIHSLYYHP